MKAELVIHTDACCQRFVPKYERAQKFLDSEVLRGSAPYVPMSSSATKGNLMKSGNTGTVIGSGKIIYNAPYAKKCYYGLHMKFNKNEHPYACAQWFEAAKAVNKTKWINGAESIIKGHE